MPAGRVRAIARSVATEPMRLVQLEARVLRPWRSRQFGAFGARSIVHRPDWIYGASHIAIGSNVLVLHRSWLAVERQAWDATDPVITIGDHTAIRPNVTLTAAERIEIGPNVVIAAFTTLVDSDHTWSAGNPSVLYNPVETSPIRVGEGTWIGERVAVLRGADIGPFCIIASNSVVRGEIPPYSVAAGSPARVVGSTRGRAPER
jgi:acetyltransferase-like isoleucine patch superfamily enzyme